MLPRTLRTPCSCGDNCEGMMVLLEMVMEVVLLEMMVLVVLVVVVVLLLEMMMTAGHIDESALSR